MLKLLSSYDINIVMDVGANIGQYAKELRNLGYTNRIISFEPLSSAFHQLQKSSSKDNLWDVYHHALGDKDCKSEINISGNFNSTSSSINEMLPYHQEVAPGSKYIGKEEIEIKTIDTVFNKLCKEKDSVYLKVDTQGFEKNVIDGAKKSLQHISTIQLEMSLVPLYENELLFNQMYDLLFQKDYRLVSLEPGIPDTKTGQLLQVDGIFHRLETK